MRLGLSQVFWCRFSLVPNFLSPWFSLHLINYIFWQASCMWPYVRPSCQTIFKDFTLLEWGPRLVRAETEGPLCLLPKNPVGSERRKRLRDRESCWDKWKGACLKPLVSANHILAPFKQSNCNLVGYSVHYFVPSLGTVVQSTGIAHSPAVWKPRTKTLSVSACYPFSLGHQQADPAQQQ